jgi:hypothetical protein
MTVKAMTNTPDELLNEFLDPYDEFLISLQSGTSAPWRKNTLLARDVDRESARRTGQQVGWVACGRTQVWSEGRSYIVLE